MFIDVTRFGGLRRLRLSVGAIAYTDEAADGCAIRLIGGESLRVNEDPETIERRMNAALGFAALIEGPIDPDLLEEATRSNLASGLISPVTAIETLVDAAQIHRGKKKP